MSFTIPDPIQRKFENPEAEYRKNLCPVSYSVVQNFGIPYLMNYKMQRVIQNSKDYLDIDIFKQIYLLYVCLFKCIYLKMYFIYVYKCALIQLWSSLLHCFI